MIECVFTIDYEIYGNGEGSLRELVYEPAQRLMALFEECNVRFVCFVEVAELEKIEACGTDKASGDVRSQVREMHARGFEIGLHLHPQWCNARYQEGRWLLDYAEYNVCSLPRERIGEIIAWAIDYLRDMLDASEFTPLSFRAGNWLLQPSGSAAAVLAENGIRIDSSVFKGGLQYGHGLDYRPSLKNGYYWTFQDNVNAEDSQGALLEIPVYTNMVPFWRMLTTRRVGLQRNSNAVARKSPQRVNRFWDYLRFLYPLKFDFCRMTIDELTTMIEGVIREDQEIPNSFKPIVAIGHTKDLKDSETIGSFLTYLKDKRIKVSTFQEVYDKCRCRAPGGC